MARRRPRVVLDTNILISGIIFGGNSREIVNLTSRKKIVAVTSAPLITELTEALAQRFVYDNAEVTRVRRKLQRRFVIVHPTKKLAIVNDEPDNRVLEAAVTGRAQHIVTGDKELLELGTFRSVNIVTPRQFLDEIATTDS